MICPHCGKTIEVPKKTKVNAETYALFLRRWNEQNIIKHRKITTGMKKIIDKVLKNADYPIVEIFKAFENYATILKEPQYFWHYQWTMAEFLKRGLDRFVDEARPFDNIKKEDRPKPIAFDCGGSSY